MLPETSQPVFIDLMTIIYVDFSKIFITILSKELQLWRPFRFGIYLCCECVCPISFTCLLEHNTSPWIHLPNIKLKRVTWFILPWIGFHQHWVSGYRHLFMSFPRASFTNCSYFSSFVILCPVAWLSLSIITVRADVAGFKQRPTNNKETLARASCSLCVTGSADQSAIELSLNVCQFKNRA